MSHRNLPDFVDRLRKENEIREIDTPVSPELEITEIADRVVKSKGPALVFRNVVGHDMPLLINAFGSERRMAMALGVEKLDEIQERLRELLKTTPPVTVRGKVNIIPKLFGMR